MNERKLVIGCGYVGRRVARRWIAQGDAVFALTRSIEHARQLGELGLEPIVGDVTDAAALAGLPQADTVLYAVGLDRDSGKSQRDVYVGGLDNVLREIAGKVGRFLYVSSTSVYGQSGGEWVDESSECRPTSENGELCLEAEGLLRSVLPSAGILRLAGIYGPGRLAARIEALRAGLVLEGNPEAWLNLIHVDDAVAAIIACERRGAAGSTYLVSDGHPCRRREYYSLLAWLIGAPPPRTADLPPSAGAAHGEAGQVVGGPENSELAALSQRPAADPALNKRCSSRRLREELQVVLRYPSIKVGLPAALSSCAGQDLVMS